MYCITVATSERETLVNITPDVRRLIREKPWRSGAAVLFCPHTTCGLTINEGADPDVVRDMLRFFSEAVPQRNNWRHAEGNSDAHIKSSLLGSSLLLLIEDGDLCLGIWQSIYLYESDGPRTRNLWLQWLPAEAERSPNHTSPHTPDKP